MSPTRRTDSTVTPPSPNHRSRTDRGLSRRTFIAAGGTTALASLAGCTAVMDLIGDLALQDVNVFNGADNPVSGAVEIVDPNGDVVLEETFDLTEETDENEEDEDAESTALYDDVWTDAGDYEVSVELDENPGEDSNDAEPKADEENSENVSNDTESENEEDPETDSNDTETEAEEDSETKPSDTETVTIDDPEEERLVVGIAQEGPAELISFHVIENLSDLEDEFE